MNLLSLDGGGVRGIITLKILKEILARANKKTGRELHIADLFDFYCGSSIGTVIISALLLPDPENPSKPKYSIDDVIKQIEVESPIMFSCSIWQDIQTLWGFRLPRYINDSRGQFYEKNFDNTPFGKLLKPVVFFCGDMASGMPIYFNNTVEDYKNYKLTDILSGTTAAPTYFPSKKMTIDGRNCDLIDSGCVVNNTSLLTFVEATHMFKDKYNIEQLYQVSIGTGQVNSSNDSHFWGLFDWGYYITDILMDFNSKNQDYELSKIASGGQFDRLNPVIPSNLDYLDRPQYIKQYIEITDAWILEKGSLVDAVVDKLLKNKNISINDQSK